MRTAASLIALVGLFSCSEATPSGDKESLADLSALTGEEFIQRNWANDGPGFYRLESAEGNLQVPRSPYLRVSRVGRSEPHAYWSVEFALAKQGLQTEDDPTGNLNRISFQLQMPRHREGISGIEPDSNVEFTVDSGEVIQVGLRNADCNPIEFTGRSQDLNEGSYLLESYMWGFWEFQGYKFQMLCGREAMATLGEKLLLSCRGSARRDAVNVQFSTMDIADQRCGDVLSRIISSVSYIPRIVEQWEA